MTVDQNGGQRYEEHVSKFAVKYDPGESVLLDALSHLYEFDAPGCEHVKHDPLQTDAPGDM